MAWACPKVATLATHYITTFGKLAGMDGGILGLPIPGVSFGNCLYTLLEGACKFLEPEMACKY